MSHIPISSHLAMQCEVCGFRTEGRTTEQLERAYAAHLNDDRHLKAEAADFHSQERIRRYQLEDLASRERKP